MSIRIKRMIQEDLVFLIIMKELQSDGSYYAEDRYFYQKLNYLEFKYLMWGEHARFYSV